MGAATADALAARGASTLLLEQFGFAQFHESRSCRTIASYCRQAPGEACARLQTSAAAVAGWDTARDRRTGTAAFTASRTKRSSFARAHELNAYSRRGYSVLGSKARVSDHLRQVLARMEQVEAAGMCRRTRPVKPREGGKEGETSAAAAGGGRSATRAGRPRGPDAAEGREGGRDSAPCRRRTSTWT